MSGGIPRERHCILFYLETKWEDALSVILAGYGTENRHCALFCLRKSAGNRCCVLVSLKTKRQTYFISLSGYKTRKLLFFFFLEMTLYVALSEHFTCFKQCVICIMIIILSVASLNLASQNHHSVWCLFTASD